MARGKLGRVIVLDTSGLFAALASDDVHHVEAASVLDTDTGPFVMPAGILAEVGYMIETRLGARVVDAFLDDLITGAFTFECDEADLPRIRQLVNRYEDMPLGVADAAVIACAERTGGRILTFDRRDFGVVAREGRVHLVP
jgi:predicted nucleic acid-binding protein